MPIETLVATVIISGHLIGLLDEVRLHARHRQLLNKHGGQIQSPSLSATLYGVWAIAVPSIIVVAFWQSTWPSRQWIAFGMVIITLSQLLRRWAIQALGPYWTMSIVAVPGMRPLNTGPYRILKNPEYISRITELCGLALATAAYVPSTLTMAILSVLIFKARAIEDALQYGGNLAPAALIE